MSGVKLGAVSEIRAAAARNAVLMSGRDASDIVSASSASAIDRAIEAGKVALTDDYMALCSAGRIDVIIDATGNPNVGTSIALESMKNGKHIVMLNVELDITIGRFLKEEAKKAGVVYTGAAGDEPAATVELVGFAQALGFEIVAAGKGKNNPLQFDATPDQFEEEARRRDMNARMLVEFVDGSKTMIEMTAVANATGLQTRHSGNARAEGDEERAGAGVVHQAGRRRSGEIRRRRLFDRRGRGPGRILRRQAAAPARARTHDRLEGRAWPVFRPYPALSPDQSRSPALRDPRGAQSRRRSRSRSPSPSGNASPSPSATSRLRKRSARSANTITAGSR